MFNGYHELDALPAAAFRNPDLFVTPWDTLPENIARNIAQQQYNHGLSIGQEYPVITIGAHTVWSAEKPLSDGSRSLMSYEGIGYHACTADLLRGFLASPARIVIYRYTDHGISETCIKEPTV